MGPISIHSTDRPESGLKDNQPKLAESIQDFWRTFRAHPVAYTPHKFTQSVEKDHGRIETRRCTVFDQLECLDKPQQWKGLRCFIVLESGVAQWRLSILDKSAADLHGEMQ
jgi:hypothetical protein